MKKIPFGEFHHENPEINVIIEVPAGSSQKYAYSEQYSASVLTRSLANNLTFPFNYGYIPQTKSGDAAHLDAFVISSGPIPAHVVVPSRPIGLIEVTDKGERDNKIVAVTIGDKNFEKVNSWEDLPEELRKKLTDFYEHYPKQLEHDFEVLGFFGKQRAVEELRLTQILD